jgi:hypothetical protein
MFKNNFNIIVGSNATWKSSALHALAYDMKSQLNMKIIFLGATNEFEEKTHFLNQRYELCRFLSSDDENNINTLKVIEEISLKDGIDFIFIDDIDYLYDYLFPNNDTTTKKYINFLDKIPVRKIATCSDSSSIPLFNFSEEITDSKNYFLQTKYNKGRSYAIINDVIANDFIKAFIRDEKIKTILE